MKYGYCRVSSKSQEGNTSLELQKSSVIEAGAEIVYEDVFTGGTINRPEFTKLVESLKPGDELIITKLDRFARSVSEGASLAQKLYSKGITLNILNLGKIENTSIGNLLLNVMLSFAQFEKDMINQRCREGKMIAKQKADFREGRPKKFSKKQLQHALSLLEENSYKEVEQITGISKSTLIRAKNRA